MKHIEFALWCLLMKLPILVHSCYGICGYFKHTQIIQNSLSRIRMSLHSFHQKPLISVLRPDFIPFHGSKPHYCSTGYYSALGPAETRKLQETASKCKLRFSQLARGREVHFGEVFGVVLDALDRIRSMLRTPPRREAACQARRTDPG